MIAEINEITGIHLFEIVNQVVDVFFKFKSKIYSVRISQ